VVVALAAVYEGVLADRVSGGKDEGVVDELLFIGFLGLRDVDGLCALCALVITSSTID
jgi:hypothetical protein